MSIDPELFHAAQSLSAQGLRSEEAELMLTAVLRAFIVGPSSVQNGQVTREVQHRLQQYSKPVLGISFTETSRTYLANRGVLVVAEMYYIATERQGHKAPSCYAEIQETLGLSPNAEPWSDGWQPDYWRNEDVLRALDQEPKAYAGRPVPRCTHESTPPATMREFLVQMRKSRSPKRSWCNGIQAFDPAKLEYLRRHLGKMRGRTVHAALVLPPA